MCRSEQQFEQSTARKISIKFAAKMSKKTIRLDAHDHEQSNLLSREAAAIGADVDIKETSDSRFGGLCGHLAEESGCHAKMFSGPLRSAACGLLGGSAVVDVERGSWQEKAQSWNVISGESGLRKSLAMKRVKQLVEAAEDGAWATSLAAGFQGPPSIMRKSVGLPSEVMISNCLEYYNFLVTIICSWLLFFGRMLTQFER